MKSSKLRVVSCKMGSFVKYVTETLNYDVIYRQCPIHQAIFTNLAINQRTTRNSELHCFFEKKEHKRMKEQGWQNDCQSNSGRDQVSIPFAELVRVISKKSNQKTQ